MEWDKDILYKLEWNGKITNLEDKQKIADEIAKKVCDGDVIGFGSGSTSFLAAQAIAKRIKEENISIVAIPTSYELTLTCKALGIKTGSLLEYKPDWAFDGADEVDPNNSLIKGRGGAMFREKMIMINSPKTYILVDKTKLVNNLGEKFPVPVEIAPEMLYFVKNELKKLGAIDVTLRMAKAKDGPVITENGNLILDAKFDKIDKNMEENIQKIVGVIETGLFIGYNVEIISL